MRQPLSTLTGLGIGIACLIYVFWDLDLGEMLRTWLDYSPRAILAAVAVSLLSYLTLGLRLAFLSDHHLNPGQGFAASILALGLNNLFPAKLGELGKAFYISRHADMSFARAISLVFWERFFDLNALLVLALLATALMQQSLVSLPVVVVVAGLWGTLFVLRRWPGLAARLLRLVPGQRLRQLLDNIHRHLQSRVGVSVFASLGAITVLVWSLYALQVLLVLLWATGLPLTLEQALLVFVVSAVGMAVPSSPGAVGVYEAVMVIALGWFGVDKTQAAGAAFLTHMVQYLPTTLGAILIIARLHLDPRRLREQMTNATPKP